MSISRDSMFGSISPKFSLERLPRIIETKISLPMISHSRNTPSPSLFKFHSMNNSQMNSEHEGSLSRSRNKYLSRQNVKDLSQYINKFSKKSKVIVLKSKPTPQPPVQISRSGENENKDDNKVQSSLPIKLKLRNRKTSLFKLDKSSHL